MDLLPGEAISLSGPSALKNPLDSDVLIRFKPENAPLHFNLEGFFTGYWFGNGMWRGGVQAEPQAEPGSYELRVSFKGAAGQAEQPFVLVVWADEAAGRAGSPFLHPPDRRLESLYSGCLVRRPRDCLRRGHLSAGPPLSAPFDGTGLQRDFSRQPEQPPLPYLVRPQGQKRPARRPAYGSGR